MEHLGPGAIHKLLAAKFGEYVTEIQQQLGSTDPEALVSSGNAVLDPEKPAAFH